MTLQVEEGEILGIVGESGSGKSVSMMAMMGLVPFPGRVSADALTFEGRDLLDLPERERRKIVGKDIAMIFQEPTTSLNPSFTIGYQLTETLRVHEGMDRKSAKRRADRSPGAGRHSVAGKPARNPIRIRCPAA